MAEYARHDDDSIARSLSRNAFTSSADVEDKADVSSIMAAAALSVSSPGMVLMLRLVRLRSG